jgi:hypothetical protein
MHWVVVTKGQSSVGGSGCRLYRYFLSGDLNAGNPQDLACTSDKRWPHPDYMFYLVHKETTKEAYNEYTTKESVQPSITESIANKQDTINFKDSHAVYCLHAGDKIKFKPYLHPVTVATITEIGPSLWINDDRYTIYTDKPLIPFGDTIYNSDFFIVESKFNDAEPKGMWLNVDDVILFEGKWVNFKSRMDIAVMKS